MSISPQSTQPAGTDGAGTPATHEPRVVPKPWGRELWYADEPEYAGKILYVTAGHALSLQRHEEKKETMYVLAGRMIYHLNGDEFEIGAGSALTVRPGDVHRVTALEDSTILEVSTPHLDDVIRLEDRYGR